MTGICLIEWHSGRLTVLKNYYCNKKEVKLIEHLLCSCPLSRHWLASRMVEINVLTKVEINYLSGSSADITSLEAVSLNTRTDLDCHRPFNEMSEEIYINLIWMLGDFSEAEEPVRLGTTLELLSKTWNNSCFHQRDKEKLPYISY